MNKQQQKDIEYLRSKIQKFHFDLYRYVSKDIFSKQLDKAIDVDKKYFAIVIQEALALLRDAHTKVPEVMEVWGDKIPIRLKEIDGKYYIIGTNEVNSNLLFDELIAINGFKLQDIISKIGKLSSNENSETFKTDVERILRSVLLLEYFGFCKNQKVVLETLSGKYKIKDYEGKVTIVQPLGWKNKGLEFIGTENYRYRVIKDTLIFQYNACNNRGFTDDELHDFKKSLLDRLKKCNKLVVDLRLNNGGGTGLMGEVFGSLPDSLEIYVVNGRATFSSAMHHMLYLKNERGATLVGENAGQRPNRFGDTEVIKLPNSEIEVFCSFKYFELLPGQDIELIEPDIYLPITIENYKDKIDPLESWIKENLL